MRALFRTPWLVAISSVMAACGGSAPPPPQAPAPVVPETTPQPSVLVAPAPELASAAEPADVVAIARWRNPSASFSTIETWFGARVPLSDIEHELFRAPDNASLLATDASVDLLVALDPKASDANPQPFAAFSVGLRSLEDTKRLLDQRKRAKQIEPNVYRVEIGRHSQLSCLIAPALGSAPARLVCGDRDRDVDALYPYLTRGLPLAAPPARDLHGEVRFAPIQRRFGRQLPVYLSYVSTYLSHLLGSGERKFDNALADALSGLSNETTSLVNDLDLLSFDLALGTSDRTIDGELDLKLKSRNSWTAQRALAKASEAGPAPPIFWRLPLDSDSAFYWRGDDPKAYEAIRRAGSDLLDGVMARGKFPAVERKAATSLFERWFAQLPAGALASGHIDVPAPKPDADLVEQMRVNAISVLGWHIRGSEESPERAMGWLRDLAALYNRPAIKQWIHDQTGLELKQLPTVRVAPFAAKGLDKGTMALEISVPIPPEMVSGRAPVPAADKTRAAAPIKIWVAVMPDGQRTWMGASADRAMLEKQLAAVRAGAPDSQTITARPGLESLKTERYLSAGYISIAAAASDSVARLWGMTHGFGQHASPIEKLARIPNQGRTPILITETVQAGATSELSVKLHVAKGTIDDIQAFGGGGGGGHTMVQPIPPPPPPAPLPPRRKQ
jgi:hypothetical protein